MLGLLVALLSVNAITGGQVLWVGLALLWGVAIMAVSLALQLTVLKLAPKATDVAMSIFSGIYNVGIGGGALLGSLVISHYQLNAVGNVGAVVLLVAMFVFAFFCRASLAKSA